MVAIAADLIGFVVYAKFMMKCSDCVAPAYAFTTFQVKFNNNFIFILSILFYNIFI